MVKLYNFTVGIDIGGVCREFFNCLCDVLFGGRNPRGLFTPFKDDPQSLVKTNAEITPLRYNYIGTS